MRVTPGRRDRKRGGIAGKTAMNRMTTVALHGFSFAKELCQGSLDQQLFDRFLFSYFPQRIGIQQPAETQIVKKDDIHFFVHGQHSFMYGRSEPVHDCDGQIKVRDPCASLMWVSSVFGFSLA
jgi:hypothetical protein